MRLQESLGRDRYLQLTVWKPALTPQIPTNKQRVRCVKNTDFPSFTLWCWTVTLYVPPSYFRFLYGGGNGCYPLPSVSKVVWGVAEGWVEERTWFGDIFKTEGSPGFSRRWKHTGNLPSENCRRAMSKKMLVMTASSRYWQPCSIAVGCVTWTV